MHMAIDHARHDELARRIDDADVAAARGHGRRPADSRNPIICDTDDAILYELTVDRIEYGTADDVQESHAHLLAGLSFVALMFPNGFRRPQADRCRRAGAIARPGRWGQPWESILQITADANVRQSRESGRPSQERQLSAGSPLTVVATILEK